MVGFFKSIGNELSKIGNFVGDGIKEGFDDVKNVAQSGMGEIKDIGDNSFGLANHLVSGAEGLAGKGIDGVKGIVGGAENMLSIPLILIAGGVAFFLLSKNAGTAIEVGGRLGEKALSNPGLMAV